MKRRSGRKNNRGESLIEVVVAITVIALLTIPIIRAFLTSANANKKARRIQNATDVAQSVAEYLTKAPMSEITALTASAKNVSNPDEMSFTSLNDWRTGESDGVFTGAAGEKFKVDVTMNSRNTTWTTDVKDYTLSEFKDLFGSNAVSCMQQLTKMDDDMKDAGTVVGKVTTFDISIAKQADGTYSYQYSVTLKYGGNSPQTMMIDSGSAAEGTDFPTLYAVYSIFDTSTRTDQIYVNYNNTCLPTDNCPKFKFCLIQQRCTDLAGTVVKLNDTNFHVTENTMIVNPPFTYVTNLTNDGDITADGTRKVRVYDINVKVSLKGKEMANISSVREEID